MACRKQTRYQKNQMQRPMRLHKLIPPATATNTPRRKSRPSSSPNLRGRSTADRSAASVISDKEVGRWSIPSRYGLSLAPGLRNSKITVVVRSPPHD